MNISAVLNDLAGLLATAGIKVYPTPVGATDTPFAVIGMPQSITYFADKGGGITLNLKIEVWTKTSDPKTAAQTFYNLASFGTGSSLIDVITRPNDITSYRRLKVDSADNFRTDNEGGYAFDLNLELTA